MRHQKSLILNADFTPLGLISCKKAIKLYIKGLYGYDDGVSVVEFYKDDYVITTMGVKYPVPAVCNILRYKRIKKDSVSFSRKNVFIRDGLCCQYCNKKDIPENLEYEHVIPKSVWKEKGYEGTPTCWTNIVTACTTCNRFKGNRTPQQAGMKLLKEPLPPNIKHHVKGLTPWSKIPEEWILYLPPLYKDLCNNEIYGK